MYKMDEVSIMNKVEEIRRKKKGTSGKQSNRIKETKGKIVE